MLDVGTNNEALLNDPYYVGLRQKRLTGAAYDEFVDEFITAAREVFPGVLIQFEDFANHSAFHLLHKYRDKIPHLQRRHPGHGGGGARRPVLGLAHDRRQAPEQKLLFLGAGEAATGIADLVVSAMVAEGAERSRGARCASGWWIRAAWW